MTDNLNISKESRKEAVWSHFSTFSLIAATVVSAFSIHRVYDYFRRRESLNLPPGPTGLPVFGSFFSMKRDTLNFFTSLPIFYGPITCFNLGKTNIITVNDPYLARNIYINNSESVINRYVSGINHPNYNSFSLQNGKLWRERRKIIQSQLLRITNSTFINNITRPILKRILFKEFDDKSTGDNNNNKKQWIYTRQLFRNLVFNMIHCAIFGEYPPENGELFKKYNKFIVDIFESQHPSMEMTLFFGEKSKISKIIWENSHYKQLFMDSVQKMCDLTLSKYLKFKKNPKNGCYCDYIMKYQQDTRSKTKYSDNDIVADINVMIEAGVDTTATTLEFAVILLTIYPNIQEEIYNELKEILSINDYDDIDNFQLDNNKIRQLPKLRAFIHEILRLYPPSPQSFLRKITKDINVETDDGIKYKLPKNSLINMNIYAMNNNPKFWGINGNIDNVKDLNLNLWLDTNGKFKKHSAFTTFSLSKRDCPGRNIAIREILFVLSISILKYKFVANEANYKYASDIKVKQMFNMVMDPQIGIIVEQR